MTHTFYTLISKDIDESLVCGTLDQALAQVGDDTVGALLTERDHDGKYHTTDATAAIARKWLDRYEDNPFRAIPQIVRDWEWRRVEALERAA